MKFENKKINKVSNFISYMLSAYWRLLRDVLVFVFALFLFAKAINIYIYFTGAIDIPADSFFSDRNDAAAFALDEYSIIIPEEDNFERENIYNGTTGRLTNSILRLYDEYGNCIYEHDEYLKDSDETFIFYGYDDKDRPASRAVYVNNDIKDACFYYYEGDDTASLDFMFRKNGLIYDFDENIINSSGDVVYDEWLDNEGNVDETFLKICRDGNAEYLTSDRGYYYCIRTFGEKGELLQELRLSWNVEKWIFQDTYSADLESYKWHQYDYVDGQPVLKSIIELTPSRSMEGIDAKLIHSGEQNDKYTYLLNIRSGIYQYEDEYGEMNVKFGTLGNVISFDATDISGRNIRFEFYNESSLWGSCHIYNTYFDGCEIDTYDLLYD